MIGNRCRLLWFSFIACLLIRTPAALAVALEALSNPVVSGKIAINDSRTDWQGVDSYSPDEDPTPPGPELDFAILTMAHDATTLYVRLEMNPSPSGTDQFFGFRNNLFIDVDQNRETGFIGSGGFLAAGADILVQGNTAYSFSGPDQQSWGWSDIQSGLAYSDFPTTDIELAIPRSVFGNRNAIDFFLNAANSNFATEDFYPAYASGGALGDFLTYEFNAASTPGDLNGDGAVDASDAGIMFGNWGQTGAGNLNGDNVIDAADAGIMFANWTGDLKPAQAVPEPATCSLAIWGITAVYYYRWRRLKPKGQL